MTSLTSGCETRQTLPLSNDPAPSRVSLLLLSLCPSICLPVCSSSRLPAPAPPEMKGKNPWHSPVAIVIALVAVIAIVALVTVAVLQNKPLHQKYKVGWPVAGEAPSLRACCVVFCCVASVSVLSIGLGGEGGGSAAAQPCVRDVFHSPRLLNIWVDKTSIGNVSLCIVDGQTHSFVHDGPSSIEFTKNAHTCVFSTFVFVLYTLSYSILCIFPIQVCSRHL